MPYKNTSELWSRLTQQKTLLSRQEVADILPFFDDVRVNAQLMHFYRMHVDLLTIDLLHENIETIRKFNSSSDKLSRRIYWLTWGVFVLTGILVALTILLVVLARMKS